MALFSGARFSLGKKGASAVEPGRQERPPGCGLGSEAHAWRWSWECTGCGGEGECRVRQWGCQTIGRLNKFCQPNREFQSKDCLWRGPRLGGKPILVALPAQSLLPQRSFKSARDLEQADSWGLCSAQLGV